MPCQTLDDYNSYNSSLFSTSHAKWVFIPGKHLLTSHITIKDAVNVTLTGEHPCTNGSESHQCSNIVSLVHCNSVRKKRQGTRFGCLPFETLYNNINCSYRPRSSRFINSRVYRTPVHYMDSYSFTVVGCSHIVVSDLHLKQQGMNYGFCWKGLFKFDNVTNLTLYSVTVGNLTSPGTSVRVEKPSGVIIVNNSHFESLECVNREPVHLDLFIVQSYLTKSGIKLSFGLVLKQPTVALCRITIDSCHFDGASIRTEVMDGCNTSLTVKKCIFQNNENPLEISALTSELVMVNVYETSFIRNKGDNIVNLELDDGTNPFTRVTFYNVTFTDNSRMEAPRGCMITAALADFIPTQPSTPVVIFHNCTFQRNHLYSYQICLLNFPREYPVQFKGHNLIQQNNGGGVHLFNSLLWVDGWLEIKDNGLAHFTSMVHSGLNISDSSHILLSNNSEISIVNNKGFGIFVPFQNREDYFHPRPCFFSLVYERDISFKSLTEEDDLKNFNACLVVSRNFLMLDSVTYETPVIGNQVYNAHLQKCVMRLGARNMTLTEDEIKNVYLKLDSWDENTVGSPPYNICFCDVSGLGLKINARLCNRQLFNRTVYPGLPVTIAVVALGDLNFVQPANFTISTGEETRYYNKSIRGCTELHTFTPRWSSSLYEFTIVARSILEYEKMSVRTKVNIVVTSQCPPGMSISHSNKNNECRCNQILISHGFYCDIKSHGYHNAITYKPATSHQWLGYWNGHLVLSDYCPSHYCSSDNSSLLTTGITLEGLNTSVQCDLDSKRQGLLCSQCTTGTSSQFGSFRCAECTFAGLLLVPFGVVIGILLIVFLFLFNFTVLQGDVVGIVFYANIVCIMDEFLLKYSPRPFYGILALINVSFGLEVCFFDGMDEFAKAIIQFLFPFYLFSLVIIIIIAAHKYNLKIFRVRFVGRRSVPVLATIMLITYSGLINAVIYGLQYTTIYNVDSGTQQLVWLHQPELEYFRGKHIAVGILCLLVLLFYLLPLTIVTLFGDLFRMCSRNLWYSHFLDVFHGAFRYPFGFWFGTRLLFRMVFITLNITTNASMVAYTIFLTTGAIILLQFLLEPFRTDNVIIYRPDPERKVTRRDLMKEKISKIFRPKIIDSLFLFNIMFIATTAVLGSTDISSMYTTVGVCLSISLALIQLVAVVVHHTYHYFPLPSSTPQRMEALRERYFDFRERMREKLRTRRNRTDTPDIAPVQITYLSASMCFNSEEYTSSSSSSEEEKSDSEYREEDETKENTTMM